MAGVEALLERALAEAHSGPLLRLFVARYFRVYCHNDFMEEAFLRKLAARALPFDVAFFVMQARLLDSRVCVC